MTKQLSITNVVNVSVSAAGVGLNEYNTSNLGLFTDETPSGSFGSNGYKAYIDPTDVATDFGSNSDTYKMALAIFSQQPNILTGNGQLIVVLLLANQPAVTAVQLITFSTVPASGQYKIKHGTDLTGFILWNDNAAAIETAVQLLPGFGSVTVTGDTTVGLTFTFTGVTGPVTLLEAVDNSLQDMSNFDVFPQATTTVPGVAAGSAETLAAAVTRTNDLVQYFGVIQNSNVTDQTQANVLAAAAVIQALNKIAFFVSYDDDDIQSGGTLDLLRTGSFTQSRGIYYGDDTDINAVLMMAAYAGRALSTDFTGSNTTQNLHLKQLATIQPDPTIDQTTLDLAVAAGADSYPSLQGRPSIFTSGENAFFDQVYNLRWFVGAIQIAGFNYLATASTKVPQTENGMLGLKGAYRLVCQQANINSYAAPGTWNSPTVFGNPADLFANIAQAGFYIFSQPINQQSQANRAARIAPLVQIALKEAGGINKSNVLINVNA